MAQPKVQLVAPIGNINLPGMTATGVVTATSLSGIATGSVTNLTGSPDLDVGIVTGSSFVGDGTGHAASLTGTPNLNLGVTTATSFVGDAVGKAAGLTGTPNLNVGLITATSFVGFVTGDVTGNISGLAASITPGANLGVGVCTAIQYHGDGSGITGAGSSAYIAQNITASGDETIIDLSYGNLIYYKGQADTTVGFASTSAAEQLTFIRDTSPTFDVAYNESFTSGAVAFDGNSYLTTASSTDFAFGTGDFTMECFVKVTSYPNSGQTPPLLYSIISWHDDKNQISINENGYLIYYDGSLSTFTSKVVPLNQFNHIAYSKSGSTLQVYINGEQIASITTTADVGSSARQADIGVRFDNSLDPMIGSISNVRIIKGTALYPSSFLPPSAALTNVTNTKLLCCQSDSSTTAAAVGTITLGNGTSASSQTIAYSGTNTLSNGTITWPDRVKWNNDTTPTLITNTYAKARQIFRFTTVDTGLNYNAWEEIVYNLSQPYELFAWGDGREGALGQNVSGNPASRSSPVQITGTTWNSVRGSNDSGFAIKTDGTLWAWGSNTYGMLGQNNANPTGRASSPVQIGTDTTWDKLAETDSIQNKFGAIKTDGTLWSWGYGKNGALGLNQGGNQRSVSSPTQVGADTTWKSVRMLTSDGMEAVKTDGTFWSWGYDGNAGRLGQNQDSSNTKYSSPTQVGTNTNWSLPAGGYSSGGGFKTDGTLWLWGWNGAGQLGQNNTTPVSSPTQVGTDTTWKSGYGEMGSYALSAFMKTDGTLWVWGGDGGGSLGINVGGPAAERRSSPTQIPGTTWNSISATYSNMGATKTDGTAWVWGKDDYGNLGLNSNGAQISSPTQLPGTWSDIQVSRNENFGLQAYNG